MKIKEFISGLKQIPLEKERYSSIGLDEDEINSIMEGYNLKKTDTKNELNKLVEFIVNYNPSSLEIGSIRFFGSDEIIENKEFYIIGAFDADSLAINKFTEEIIILDSTQKLEFILWKCAKNADSFFESLLIAGKFLEENAFSEEYGNQDLIFKVAQKCSFVAGGKDYLSFYSTLLGVE